MEEPMKHSLLLVLLFHLPLASDGDDDSQAQNQAAQSHQTALIQTNLMPFQRPHLWV